MKVSLNWVKEFTDVKLSPDELVKKIGAQLGGIEEVIDFAKKYQGIVVGKIITCGDHPNADKLRICKIDDGGTVKDVERDEDGYIQVVCGAPNAREDILVAWLPPGTTVPSTINKDPFVLEAREFRGQMSNGMLASPKELALSDSHEGILEIKLDAKPGDSFAAIYGLDDYIIDIENKMFTHRPDLFGQLGVAREIAGISGQSFRSPAWYMDPQESHMPKLDELPLQVINEVPELAPRFMAVAISGIQSAPSPLWMQAALSRVGVRAINNIVDVTNYMMYLTAQPMHAFDYHKLKRQSGKVPTIGPRLATEGEELTLLGAKKIRLTKDDIVIATDKKAVDLAGIMGGTDTEVDDATTAIILTISNFDMYAVRRAMMRHGTFTEAATRNTKGQSAAQAQPILYKTMDLISEICGGAKQSSKVFDIYPKQTHNLPVTLDINFINVRLGLELSGPDVQTLLKNVEFKVNATGDDVIEVTAPFWRTDIEIPEDIVEEVGRLYGYDHLQLELPKRDLTPAQRNSMIDLKEHIRGVLATGGANELLTYSFVHGNLLDKVGQDKIQAFHLTNALSPDLQYYRLSLMPSLLDKVHPNIKAGYDRFALFELGRAHIKSEVDEEGLPGELQRAALVVAAADKIASTTGGAPFYEARKHAANLLYSLGVNELKFLPFDKSFEGTTPTIRAWSAPYAENRAAFITSDLPDRPNTIIGIVGEFNQSVTKNLKLPKYCSGFELDASVLQVLYAENTAGRYNALPRFPRAEQDITLKVPAATPYDVVYRLLSSQLLHQENTHATLAPMDIYQREDDNAHKQMSFRFVIAHYQKTLQNKEVNALLDQAAVAAQKELGAERL